MTEASEVLVPIGGSTLMLTEVARKHHLSEARVAEIWRDCIAHFHPAETATAHANANRRTAEIFDRKARQDD